MKKITMNDPLAVRIRELLNGGTIPASSLSMKQRRRLQPLFDSGVLESRRAGAGRRIKVVRRDALEAFSRKLFPSGPACVTSCHDILPRADGILAHRDAKVASSTWAEPVLLRGFKTAKLTSTQGDLPVAELTALSGLTAIRLHEPFKWGFRGIIAVAENLEFFLSFERTGLQCDLVIYGGGRVSNRVLSWLSNELMADCRVLHCADYDPAGMEEFLRLRKYLGDRAELYVPADFEALLKKYGKAKLVGQQAHILSRIRSCTCPEILEIIGLLEDYGLGLEQEVLLAAAG